VLDWMLRTPTPFAERMTFFWHGHFTSDFRKVNLQTPFIYWQNLTWRQMSLGNLHEHALPGHDRSGMLRYPTSERPREKRRTRTTAASSWSSSRWASDVHEDDVRAGAKALSGWREPVTQAMYDALVARAQHRPPRPAERHA